MYGARRKSVYIKLNADELYILSERIRWKINMFLNLSYHVYSNDKDIKKRIKSYFLILQKIVNLEKPKPLINSINIKLTSDEVLTLWEIFNKIDSEYEIPLQCLSINKDIKMDLIESIKKVDVTYKDLDYIEKIYVYLYTEIAICMRNSNTQNIYLDGTLLQIRNTYIYEYLSDYTCIYETDIMDYEDMTRSFYIIEPRYNKLGKEKVKLHKIVNPEVSSLVKLTLKDITDARDFIDNSQLDYNYLEDNCEYYSDDNSEYIDELESDIYEAKRILIHEDYGPGWRFYVFFPGILDINGNELYGDDDDLNDKTIDRLEDFPFINLSRSILDKDIQSDLFSKKLSILENMKSNYEKLLIHPLICQINTKSRR